MAPAIEDKDAVVERIVSSTGKTKEDVESLIQEKMKKFSGLLTDSGAAIMIAKELKADVSSIEKPRTATAIKDLEEGMNNIELTVRVKHVFAPKRFDKQGKKGVLQSLVVEDPTGEIRLTLWHDDVKKFAQEKIERKAVLRLDNCYVSSYNEKKQLNLGRGGSFEVKTEKIAGLAEPEDKTIKLADVKPELNDIDVYARIARVYEEREFESQGRKGRLISFELVDETGRVRATAWNDLVESVNGLEEGKTVKVEGAYTKQGLRGVDLQLGWTARVVEEPKGIELPALSELKGIKVEKKKLNELVEGSTLYEVKAGIVELNRGNLRYNVCPKCGKKPERVDQGFVCNACGQIDEPDINLVASVEIDDGSLSMRAVFFGKQAEKLLGIGKEELKKKLEEKQAEDIVEELQGRLSGKEITLQGVVRENQNSGLLELIARDVVKVE